ncbi:protein-export chaperone SecB [Hydrogenophilus thiooxidans]|uniref:protein-export chaperone SecB n=1 Tax=Hydrogenophilus thiooxidans TaxID=2820326 RepID=UPI001C231C5E|nr:protein-export chaperone SecB [Hydrogenophilus thiooxidans]
MSETHSALSGNDPSQAPMFTIEKLYVKDLSVEVPRAPDCFLETQAPNIQVEMGTAARKLDAAHYEVALTLSVKASVEERAIFLIELTYGGVFQVRNVPESDVEPLLFVACPSILYPYAREVISDASTRAGFQPVLLAPVNFEALYLQQKQQAQQAPSTTTPQ